MDTTERKKYQREIRKFIKQEKPISVVGIYKNGMTDYDDLDPDVRPVF